VKPESENDVPGKAERREKKKARRKYGQSGGSLRTVYPNATSKRAEKTKSPEPPFPN
jgi:hypothetical protein